MVAAVQERVQAVYPDGDEEPPRITQVPAGQVVTYPGEQYAKDDPHLHAAQALAMMQRHAREQRKHAEAMRRVFALLKPEAQLMLIQSLAESDPGPAPTLDAYEPDGPFEIVTDIKVAIDDVSRTLPLEHEERLARVFEAERAIKKVEK